MTAMEPSFRTKIVKVEIPTDANLIFGQTHFIKTVEDLYEALVTASPTLKFGIAFCEASQQRLIRCDGNDDDLIKMVNRLVNRWLEFHDFPGKLETELHDWSRIDGDFFLALEDLK